jgi:NTE family protein
MQPSWLDRAVGNGNMDYSPGYLFFDWFTNMMSPYQFNLMDYNPLKDILLELVDFNSLRQCNTTKLFVCATNVRTSRPRIFTTPEISVDAVLASACLPFIFKAVEIDGEAYWDGGYMGNPPIFPLIDKTATQDILLIQINPIRIHEIPTTPQEIRDRINEISFNSSLMYEMRRINSFQKMLERGESLDGKLRSLYIHNIFPEDFMASLNVSSKLNADWDFLQSLRVSGRKMAECWLEQNYEWIGKKSTCDIVDTFL